MSAGYVWMHYVRLCVCVCASETTVRFIGHCNPLRLSLSAFLYLYSKCQCINAFQRGDIATERSRETRGCCVPWESRVSSMAEAGGDLQGEIGVYWVLPWAYCVIIDLSHYANVEKQLACVFVCVFVGLFFFFTRVCVCACECQSCLPPHHQLLKSGDERADRISQARAFSR